VATSVDGAHSGRSWQQGRGGCGATRSATLAATALAQRDSASSGASRSASRSSLERSVEILTVTTTISGQALHSLKLSLGFSGCSRSGVSGYFPVGMIGLASRPRASGPRNCCGSFRGAGERHNKRSHSVLTSGRRYCETGGGFSLSRNARMSGDAPPRRHSCCGRGGLFPAHQCGGVGVDAPRIPPK
jgi:hypothetical protein